MSNENLKAMVVDATALGWKRGDFPAVFHYYDKTWTQEEITKTESGEIMCANYKSGEEWLIVANV
jgi:hypothetical protein